jgi:hypothetical protein
VPKKSWRNTSHIVEAKMSDDIERDGRKEALINKITKEIGEHRSLGKKMSTTKAIAEFQPEIDALGASASWMWMCVHGAQDRPLMDVRRGGPLYQEMPQRRQSST